MVTTKIRSEVINITTTGDSFNSLAGDCVALGVGLVSVVVFSFAVPDKRPLEVVTEAENGPDSDAGRDGDEARDAEKCSDEKHPDQTLTSTPAISDPEGQPDAITRYFQPSPEPYVPPSALTLKQVKSQRRLALGMLTFNVLGLMVLLPFTLYGTGYTFSLGFFKGYVVVAFVWIWASAVICVILPIWEARSDWMGVVESMWRGGRG
jgi:urea-proton symporter